MGLQGSGLAGQDTPQCPSVHPKDSYQAGQDVSRDEHVEDVVPAGGRDEPGQQRPQSRTCGAQCQGRAPAKGPGARPRDGSSPRRMLKTRLSARPPGARSQTQTYGAGAVDDGRDGGQGLCVAFQALVCPLGRESRVRPELRGSTGRRAWRGADPGQALGLGAEEGRFRRTLRTLSEPAKKGGKGCGENGPGDRRPDQDPPRDPWLPGGGPLTRSAETAVVMSA